MKELLNDIGIKKIGIIAGVFIGIIVVIVVGLKLFNSFFAGTSYSKIETTMVEAAKEYYAKNPKLLPQMSGGNVTVNATNLTSNGHMKDLTEYTKKVDSSISCAGSVSVTNINGKYRYTPNLKCGEKYATETLVAHIRNQEPLMNSGSGLYELNGGYVFRGDSPNNFVKFSDDLWSIVKIEDDYVYLFYRGNKEFINVWDNRYNIDRGDRSGINTYSVSRIATYLDDLYNGTQLLNDTAKMMLTPYNVAVGKRDSNVVANDGSVEKSEVLENKYFGLLPLYDLINASTDEHCNAASSKSCGNYNYFSYVLGSWWTATADSSNTYQSYLINGAVVSQATSDVSAWVRPVVRLVNDALYVSGDGTEANPYVIK